MTFRNLYKESLNKLTFYSPDGSSTSLYGRAILHEVYRCPDKTTFETSLAEFFIKHSDVLQLPNRFLGVIRDSKETRFSIIESADSLVEFEFEDEDIGLIFLIPKTNTTIKTKIDPSISYVVRDTDGDVRFSIKSGSSFDERLLKGLESEFDATVLINNVKHSEKNYEYTLNADIDGDEEFIYLTPTFIV